MVLWVYLIKEVIFIVFSKKRKNKLGFTLTELIAVIAILAIIIAVAAPKLGEYLESAKKTVIVANTRAFHISCVAAVVDILSSQENIPLTKENISTYRKKYVEDEGYISQGYYALHNNEIISSFIRKDGYVVVYPEMVYVDNINNDYVPPKPMVTVGSQVVSVEWIQII